MDRRFHCSHAQQNWNTPLEPFRIFGNTYYVGTAGLSAILITSDAGHILIDGALPQSAALIEANIRTLGFQPRDVRLILNSHEHYDHAGGLGLLQRATGARVAASPSAARALRQGRPTDEDPQQQSGLKAPFEAVKNVEAIADGTTLRIDLWLSPRTSHRATRQAPPHGRGGRAKASAASTCMPTASRPSPTMAFVSRGMGSVRRSSTPSAAASRVEELPCDVILAPHPEFVALMYSASRCRSGRTSTSSSRRTPAAPMRQRRGNGRAARGRRAEIGVIDATFFRSPIAHR